jgi:hypothetical protein
MLNPHGSQNEASTTPYAENVAFVKHCEYVQAHGDDSRPLPPGFSFVHRSAVSFVIVCAPLDFLTKMSMMSQHRNIVRIQKNNLFGWSNTYIQPWRTQVLILPALRMPILLIGLMYNLKQAL